MFCNGLCGVCQNCQKDQIVPVEHVTINQETVLKDEKHSLSDIVPVSAEYALEKNIFGKEKIRRLK